MSTLCTRKGVSSWHKKRKVEENSVPVVSVDYTGLKHREPLEEQYPIVVICDRKSKMKRAHAVPAKGLDHYAVDRVAKGISNILGYKKFVLRVTKNHQCSA